MRMMLIPCLALFLAGCATTNSNPDSVSSQERDLPPVSVFYSDLSDSLREDCNAYKSRSVLHYCEENDYSLHSLANALKDTGRFEEVTYGRSDTDYQVLISASRKSVDDAKGFANAVMAGATLTLIPVQNDMILNADFVVLWRGEVIDRFSHEFPATQSSTMLKTIEPQQQFVAQQLAERLMQDFNQHNPFTAERLAEALESSDYSQLDMPEQLAGYHQTEQHRYHDPLLGSMVSYTHNQFAFDRIDVFVYPIRSTDWSNASQTIESEMDNVRSEILHLEREGYIKEVELNNALTSRWDTADEGAVVGFMDGAYSSDQPERIYTSTYAFIKEDKFVKVRASFPISDEASEMQAPDEFVRALMTSISVPAESLFMARVRENHRGSSMND